MARFMATQSRTLSKLPGSNLMIYGSTNLVKFSPWKIMTPAQILVVISQERRITFSFLAHLIRRSAEASFRVLPVPDCSDSLVNMSKEPAP